MSDKTSFCIYGFWFHVSWEDENIGYDQHGRKWYNKKYPQLEEKEMDRLLDIVSDTKEKIFNLKK